MSYGKWTLPAMLLLFVLPPLTGAAGADDPAIAYPDALGAAAVSVKRLKSILEDALIVGNGDLNALVYTEAGQLRIKLTKNDVWDARFDAKLDPPLPKFEWVTRLASQPPPHSGNTTILEDGWGNHGDDAYHAHAYPCQRACASIAIGDRPDRPVWRSIRAQGSHNAFAPGDGVAVMSIAGAAGASNGYSWSPPDATTDRYGKLRVRLSGSENAQYFIDMMDPAGEVVFKTGWTEAPVEPIEQVYELPPGRPIERLIFYTWTEDGNLAENRIESVTLEGADGSLSIDLSAEALDPPSPSARLDLRRAVARVAGPTGDEAPTEIRILAQSNVVLIEAPTEARLLAIGSSDLPDAESGEREGVAWILQRIPGDPDWPGMSFAVASASGEGRTAVAVATPAARRRIPKPPRSSWPGLQWRKIARWPSVATKPSGSDSGRPAAWTWPTPSFATPGIATFTSCDASPGPVPSRPDCLPG